jgi:hypothetical protein
MTTPGRQITADRAPVYGWLYELGKEPGIIAEGSTEVLDDLIVTTVPYHCYREQKSVWLDRGASIRRQRGSQWLVLHHIPPIAYPGSTREETEAAKLLLRLPRQQLEANRQRRECIGARTAFERTLSEPYRSEYGVEGGGLGNVESGVDS